MPGCRAEDCDAFRRGQGKQSLGPGFRETIDDRQLVLRIERLPGYFRTTIHINRSLGSDPGTQGLKSHTPVNNEHFVNFIECMRSRKAEDLHAPILEGHLSATLVHLANASYRLGRAH